MPKLKLIAEPKFTASVGIPIAGGDPVEVNMTFKHRTATALHEFIGGRAGKSDVETFLEMVEAWELDDPFTKESIETLFENYAGASIAVYRKYVDELLKFKVKN